MCKPGKSFNTGVKVIFRHMKVPCKSSRAGGAPPRTDALIGPAACGRCPKTDSLKRRASVRARLSWTSLESLNSLESLEATLPAFATAPSNARRSAGHSPRNQPSEEVQDRAKAVTSRSNEFNDCRAEESFPGDVTQQSFPEEARTDHVTPETKSRINTLNSRGKRSQNIHPA